PGPEVITEVAPEVHPEREPGPEVITEVAPEVHPESTRR
ncbi:MAG: hypothetical protein QOE15_1939, partial [Acidimicrobiaceae bacterium]|nr:hypothetical protein [Acidimicrobiaceae bacterium]